MTIDFKTISFTASSAPDAEAAREELVAVYGDTPLEEADVIVALGGDGFMLQTLHKAMNSGKHIYGMNKGSVGFLMNRYSTKDLHERIAAATENVIHPLEMKTEDAYGNKHTALAINEVSLLRQSYQAAKLRVDIDGRTRLAELTCDGLLLATPAGSTAYNLSAHGPILPLDTPLMALTPVSAFRPRHWRGALLPEKVVVDITVLEVEKRPVNAVADHQEVKSINHVRIRQARDMSVSILSDSDYSWSERILSEQFSP
ncbi:NAD kinase [Rhizobium sp. C1]|uniref:NAD kinase n=1 Tax=Rhizobium sp. C1 TaxID=1349799 RepID=UPI001E3D1D0F|nr:NAD kinase [Rhizobium sp. C1]MCD2177749.1 NAD kinase [Rhizobium sp. C1]HZG28136.1 NAD kinase [Ensifer sp.]